MSVIYRDRNAHRPLKLAVRFSLMAFAAVSLAACKTTSLSDSSSGTMATASLGEVSIKETAAVGNRWKANKSNKKLGLQYAGRLKSLGQVRNQLKVMDELTRLHPQDTQLQVVYGKELIISGQTARGQSVLQKVADAGKADWKAYSALGSALDQQGKHAKARNYYEAALKSRPGEISILNNMAMSHLLEGDLAQSETLFKQIDAMPSSGSEPRIRQNLALSVGLQGRFDEAREIASRDLPPEAVEANLAYLKKMLAQPNTWQKLQPGAPQPTAG